MRLQPTINIFQYSDSLILLASEHRNIVTKIVREVNESIGIKVLLH